MYVLMYDYIYVLYVCMCVCMYMYVYVCQIYVCIWWGTVNCVCVFCVFVCIVIQKSCSRRLKRMCISWIK